MDKLTIKNYKSILDIEIELGQFNLFIGENGSGKSNILEAVAFLSAAKNDDLTTEELSNRGIRITKPSLINSSFINFKTKSQFTVKFEGDSKNVEAILSPEDENDIYSKWQDKEVEAFRKKTLNLLKTKLFSKKSTYLNALNSDLDTNIESFDFLEFESLFPNLLSDISNRRFDDFEKNFLIYGINSNILRGVSSLSKKTPLGIYGEGLDVLISNFNKKENDLLSKYFRVIPWLKEIFIDKQDILKSNGFKMGRSDSKLYFIDKYMKKNNNIFSAENANEGALFVLFYLALFISEKTPKFFGIDNIETALNPKLCRDTVKLLAELSQTNNKHVLLTTHSPAALDGLNLNDDNQRLFVVKRSDEGHTKVERIKFKPTTNNGEQLKLSELWMRGYLGGLSTTNF